MTPPYSCFPEGLCCYGTSPDSFLCAPVTFTVASGNYITHKNVILGHLLKGPMSSDTTARCSSTIKYT